MDNAVEPRKNFHPEGILLLLLLLLSVFTLALNKIHSTDAWMHLSFGRLIWETGSFPEHEMFTYPSMDWPFSYSSWLFGLVAYLSFTLFGGAGPVILKAIVITLAFLIVFKDSLIPHRNYFVTALAVPLAVAVCQYRFVVRPDVFLMVFIAFSVFSLNAYYYERRKYLYSLPLIHMLWANSHSSIILMFVPFFSFIVGGAAQIYMEKKRAAHLYAPSTSQLKTLAMVFGLSFAASLISPYFLEQYSFGAGILSTQWYKKEIFELMPPEGSLLLLVHIMNAVIAVSFILNFRKFSPVHALLVIPFMILPYYSRRFDILPAILGAPVVARNISEFLVEVRIADFFRRKPFYLLGGAWIILLFSLAVLKVYPFGQDKQYIGLGFDERYMPQKAVDYLDENNIRGRVLNSFHFGQYIIWRSYPSRTVFIDGRGYLAEDILDKYKYYMYSPAILDELYNTYGFESILVAYPIKTPSSASYDVGFSHPKWTLVFWDDVSMLFLRKGGPYENLIESDAYREVKPDLHPDYFMRTVKGIERKKRLLAELLRNSREIGSTKAFIFIQALYAYSTPEERRQLEEYRKNLQ